MKFKTKEDLENCINEVVKTAVGAGLKEVQAHSFQQLVELTKGMHSGQSKELSAAQKSLNAGKTLLAIAASKGSPERAVSFAKKTYGEDSEVTKSLTSSIAADGGILVAPDFVEGVIELLRPASVIRRMNPTVLPMPNGNLNLPGLASGATGGYVGEAKQGGVSQPTFRSVHLSAKKQLQLVPVSNDLFRYVSDATAGVVRDDLVAAVQQTSDLAFIRSDGTQNNPKGLRYLADANNVLIANATVNLDNVTADIGSLMLALRSSNVRFLQPGWLMSPRTERYLKDVRVDLGAFAFREEMNTGMFWGYPYGVTSQIPENLGGGGNETELYFVDFADVVIGDTVVMEVDSSGDTAYYDENNNVVSAFQNDLTVLRAISEHDINVRHPESVAVLTEVTWGV